jgi:CO/xanthine dehydrogenase Mo-binding subunit
MRRAPQAAFAIERTMDKLARLIGLDPPSRARAARIGIASFAERGGGPPDSDESGSVEVAPAASARPAVINAVCDALEVDHIDMPLTPRPSGGRWARRGRRPRRPTWPGRDTTVRSAN